MKVTHVEDHVTHAVISGAQAIDFGISDSPEFFNILSSTLYTDQKLAVIRETLCNAWDAHIEFKCEHLAVDITLTDDYLTIRDYGPGIAPKMIGPVYGTYGGSTKTSNGQVTGGFGLGCKAPFAYVDDFEVISYHDGKYTIYRLSKSNAEVGGKPSIVPVVSDIPTTEHGLQVKIAVKSVSDRIRFHTLIDRIVQNGAMKMNLNGDPLKTLPFDDMQHGFMLTKTKVQENYAPITIRYGNVIYPIEPEQTYVHEWEEITKFLNRLANGRHGYGNREWSLVLQAAPNTVSVTPSRESLSNQKHTLETIVTLMRDFLAVRDKELYTECFRLLEERIDISWIASSPSVLFSTVGTIPNLGRHQDEYGHFQNTKFSDQITLRENLTTFPQFVQQYAASSYPDFPGFARRDRLRRISALIQSGFGGTKGKKILRSYRRALLVASHQGFNQRYKPTKSSRHHSDKTQESPWFHKEIVAPLIKGMDTENGLKADKLFVYPSIRRYSITQEIMFPVKSWNPRSIEEMWPFARNIVILSFNKVDVKDGMADDFAISKFWLGSTQNSLVYVCTRAEAKVQAARDYFTKAGVHLIDLTVKQHENYVERQESYVHTPSLKRPKRNGIPVLSKMRKADGSGHFWNQPLDNADNEIERTTTPKFVLKDGRRNEYDFIDGLSRDQSKLILDVFGDQGGLCVNQNQYDRYINAGALDWKDYILNKLVEEFTNNPRIREYIPFMPERLDTGRHNLEYKKMNAWYKIIHSEPDLFDYFELVDNLTDEDRNMIKVYKIMVDGYLYNGGDQLKLLDEILKSLPVSPIMKKLFDSIKSSKVIDLFDVDRLSQAFVYGRDLFVTEAQRLHIRDTLLFAIEG